MAEWRALLAIAVYLGLLYALATWVERGDRRGASLARSPWVYALAQAVYCTTWTYYGSVGFAASSGLLFLTVYLGPTLVAIFWWTVLRRLVRIKETYRVTGLPDLLALRYGRSAAVAAAATAILVVGLVPYVALQLKTMITTTSLVSGVSPSDHAAAVERVGLPLVGMLLLATVLFGLRRVRPAERHPGLMAALAVESVVKLVAFLAAGAFVTYGLFDGFTDVFDRAAAALPDAPPLLGPSHGAATWVGHLVVSGAAILVLPRQFHVGVVESSSERQIRTAMWAFPAYLLATNLFVLPIALGGLLLGHPLSEADTFVLHLPYGGGAGWLTGLVYLGGISAGLGMVVVETTALATAMSNHFVLPLLSRHRQLRPLLRRQLVLRWVAAASFLACAFVVERTIGAQYELAAIGLVAFAAVLQLAPALLAGLYARRASVTGALAGMSAGFAVWVYTLVLPALAGAGVLPASFVAAGPLGIDELRPHALLGIGGLDPITHTVLWSLLANVGALVLGSVIAPPAADERARASRLVDVLAPTAAPPPATTPAGTVLAHAEEKRSRLVSLFAQYHGDEAAVTIADACLTRVGAGPSGSLAALQLAELESEAETALGASIGAAAAHAAVAEVRLLTPEESRAVSAAYAEILASLRVSPSELQRKIDFHRERERLLAREAAAERFLAEVSAQLAASLDFEDTAHSVVHLPIPRLATGALLFTEREGRPPRAWLAHADPEVERCTAGWLADVASALRSAPPVQRALASRRATVTPGRTRWPAPLEQLEHDESVTAPLVTGRRVIGTLTLFLGPRSTLSLPADLPFVGELARRCAISLENAALFGDAQEAIRARDEFLAVASHELKTPLTPLRISVQALKRATARDDSRLTPERREELFRAADAQIGRLAALVDDLLDATRIGSRRLRLQRSRVDLGATVRAVVERHAPELEQAGSSLRLEVADGVVGEWDPMRVEQVVTNLLTNAMKYAPGCPIEVTVEGDDRTARLVVRDRGPGIGVEDQERIFRPFERAVSYLHVSGFGLGLYIVREVVAAHGGTVRVESARGEGCAFLVELPRSAS
jgi:signal transduction histidine kinase/Na+/proline symporter